MIKLRNLLIDCMYICYNLIGFPACCGRPGRCWILYGLGEVTLIKWNDSQHASLTCHEAIAEEVVDRGIEPPLQSLPGPRQCFTRVLCYIRNLVPCGTE